MKYRDRIDAFEVLLESPVRINIELEGKRFSIKVPSPATFFFQKSIIFSSRSDATKKSNDLYTVFWGLKFCPDPQNLIKEILDFRNHDYFESFHQNLKKYLGDSSKPGYLLLRPFLRSWLPEKDINSEIKNVFQALFMAIASKG